MKRILALDDDQEWLLYLKKVLSSAGYEVLPLLRSDNIVNVIRENSPDLLITDILMPGLTGSNVYSLVRQNIGANLPILVCSSTRMKIRGKDPLLDHCGKLEPMERLLESVQSLLASAAQLKIQSDEPPPQAELEIDV